MSSRSSLELLFALVVTNTVRKARKVRRSIERRSALRTERNHRDKEKALFEQVFSTNHLSYRGFLESEFRDFQLQGLVRPDKVSDCIETILGDEDMRLHINQMDAFGSVFLPVLAYGDAVDLRKYARGTGSIDAELERTISSHVEQIVGIRWSAAYLPHALNSLISTIGRRVERSKTVRDDLIAAGIQEHTIPEILPLVESFDSAGFHEVTGSLNQVFTGLKDKGGRDVYGKLGDVSIDKLVFGYRKIPVIGATHVELLDEPSLADKHDLVLTYKPVIPKEGDFLSAENEEFQLLVKYLGTKFTDDIGAVGMSNFLELVALAGSSVYLDPLIRDQVPVTSLDIKLKDDLRYQILREKALQLDPDDRISQVLITLDSHFSSYLDVRARLLDTDPNLCVTINTDQKRDQVVTPLGVCTRKLTDPGATYLSHPAIALGAQALYPEFSVATRNICSSDKDIVDLQADIYVRLAAELVRYRANTIRFGEEEWTHDASLRGDSVITEDFYERLDPVDLALQTRMYGTGKYLTEVLFSCIYGEATKAEENLGIFVTHLSRANELLSRQRASTSYRK